MMTRPIGTNDGTTAPRVMEWHRKGVPQLELWNEGALG